MDGDELLAMIFLLLIAGHETTVNLIGNGTLTLLENPEQMERLRSDPSLIKSAIEELLRFNGPLETATERYAREDVEIRGVTIPKGGLTYAVLVSANRDVAEFENADLLDMARNPNRHLAFGYGIHYCLGAPLRAWKLRLRLARCCDGCLGCDSQCRSTFEAEHQHGRIGNADDNPCGNGVLLWFEVDDFDAVMQGAAELGVDIVIPRHRNPPDGDGRPNHWECWLRDPDGYLVVVLLVLMELLLERGVRASIRSAARDRVVAHSSSAEADISLLPRDIYACGRDPVFAKNAD